MSPNCRGRHKPGSCLPDQIGPSTKLKTASMVGILCQVGVFSFSKEECSLFSPMKRDSPHSFFSPILSNMVNGDCLTEQLERGRKRTDLLFRDLLSGQLFDMRSTASS